MTLRAASGANWQFDRFTLLPEKRLLLNDGAEVPLTSKAFDILAFLVANRDRLVTKHELLREIWPDVVVEEGNLTQQIFVVRKALGESAQQPRHIVTVPGHGYRFTAPVREISSDQTATASAERESSSSLAQVRRVPLPLKVGLFVAGMVTIVAVVFMLEGIVPADRPSPLDSASVRLSKLTETGKATSATISPDGRYIAYAENDGDEYGLVVQEIASGAKAQVVVREPRMLGSLAFSPDGQHLYFTRGVINKGGFVLHRVPSIGGVEVPVLDNVDSAVSFSPDGRRFVFMRGAGPLTHIVVANVDGSAQQIVATRTAPVMFWFAAPSWSPDGKLIAASSGDTERNLSSIVVIPVDGSPSRELYTSDDRVGAVRWLPDGSGLLTVTSETLARQFAPWLTPTVPFSGGPIWRIAYPEGTAERLTPDLAEYDLCCVGVAANGSRAVGVLNSLVSDLWIASADDPNALRQITWGSPILSRHTWLPDNDTVVYRDIAGRLNGVRRSGGGFRLPVPDRLKVVGGVSACGDGRHVVFAATPGNNVWRLAPQGGEAVQLTHGLADSDPACTPDGKWVVYTSMKSQVASLWRLRIDGGEPELVVDRVGGTFEVLPSPGGGMIFYPAFEWDNQPVRIRRMRWLVISSADRKRLYTLNAPEGTTGIPGVPPVWAPDESGLDYVVTRNGISNIWRLPLAGGPAKQITTFTSGKIFTFAWSSDGKWLSLGSGINRSDVALISREH